MSGCEKQSDISNHVIARFEGTDITMNEANFYLVVNQVNYEMEYTASYPGEDIWKMDLLGTGNTLETDVKSSILYELKQMHILLKKAEEFGIVLDREDEEELLVLEEIFRARYSKDVCEALHMEEGILQEQLRNSMLAAKVKEVICTENGWTAENREEKFLTIYNQWAENYSFTFREVEWSEIHFEQGKYNIIKEEKEENHEEIN